MDMDILVFVVCVVRETEELCSCIRRLVRYCRRYRSECGCDNYESCSGAEERLRRTRRRGLYTDCLGIRRPVFVMFRQSGDAV